MVRDGPIRLGDIFYLLEVRSYTKNQTSGKI